MRRVPDGADEGDRQLVSDRKTGIARRLDDGGGGLGRPRGDDAARAPAPIRFHGPLLHRALRGASWRSILRALAATTYAAAAFIWLRIPDAPKHPQTTGLATQWAGVKE